MSQLPALIILTSGKPLTTRLRSLCPSLRKLKMMPEFGLGDLRAQLSNWADCWIFMELVFCRCLFRKKLANGCWFTKQPVINRTGKPASLHLSKSLKTHLPSVSIVASIAKTQRSLWKTTSKKESKTGRKCFPA